MEAAGPEKLGDVDLNAALTPKQREQMEKAAAKKNKGKEQGA